MSMVKLYENNGVTIKILQDDDCQNPRAGADGRLGTMRLKSGKRHFSDLMEGEPFDSHTLPYFAFLQIYAFAHSGVALSTTDFVDRFDSWHTGVIYVTKAHAEELLQRVIGEEDREHIEKMLSDEVHEYGQWINGETYGYHVKIGTHEDECWGFVGIDVVTKEAESRAASLAEAYEEERAAEKDDEMSDVEQSASDWVNGNRKDIVDRVRAQASPLEAAQFVSAIIGEIETNNGATEARCFRNWFEVHGSKQ